MYDALKILRDERLRDMAAREVVEGIRRDATAAPSELQAVFLYTAEHLFDAGLVAAMARCFEGERGSFRKAFHAMTGASPEAYVAQRRILVGDRLTRETPLTAKTVARVLGFAGTRSHRRAASDWAARTAAAPSSPLAGDLAAAADPLPVRRVLFWRSAGWRRLPSCSGTRTFPARGSVSSWRTR